MFARTFSKTFSSISKARAVFAAIEPETGAAHERRAKTRLTVKNKRVEGSISATDRPAMTASAQNYLALLEYVGALDSE